MEIETQRQNRHLRRYFALKDLTAIRLFELWAEIYFICNAVNAILMQKYTRIVWELSET